MTRSWGVAASLVAALLVATLATPHSARAQQDSVGTLRLTFASAPWLNLHNFLVREAKDAAGIRDESLGAKGYVAADTAARRALTAEERERWARAVAYYRRVHLPDEEMHDPLVANVDLTLAVADTSPTLDGVDLPGDLAAVLRDVMPVYRDVWWPVHDARNRAWIDAVGKLLERYEKCLTSREARALRVEWPAAPLRVDAAVYASWFGAYSTLEPAHVVIASNAVGSQNAYGLELVLHEAGHALMARVDSALATESARQGKALPNWLSHLVLFYTVGELIREQIPEHSPYPEEFGVWRQNGTARRYRSVIGKAWQPYLDGKRAFPDAIAALVRSLE